MNRRWPAMLVVVLSILASSLVQTPHADAKPRPKCLGKKATIVGNKKANTLKGTKKADVIVGLAGNDRITGGGGADRICGGGGKDRILGGAGNDRMDGGKGSDECRQQAGTGMKKNCEGPKFQLAASKTGTGAGAVTSSPSGIDCGTACAADFMEGQNVTVTASASSGSTFTGWGGACTGTGSCLVWMGKALSVVATFTAAAPPQPPPPPPSSFTLTVTTAGSGSGSASSSPAGISCGADCSESYTQGTSVTLSASPAGGSLFSGWSGACLGTGNCVLSMDEAKSVTATFLLARTLTLNKSGSGTGTVSSSPAGINCGSDCNEVYGDGTSVTLTATSDIGSTFGVWSGCDSVAGVQCTVAMSASRTVEATFTATNFTLTVTEAGTGSGSVASSPPGISCPPDCTEVFGSGQTVTLSATADAGSVLTAWSVTPGGGCSGTGTCVITMDADKTVTATFTVGQTLTVTKNGNGSGSLTSSPPGITCGADCTHDYAQGTSVVLTASENSGSTFAGWSGCDSVAGNQCTVAMTTNRTVTATFNLITHLLTVQKGGSGTGTVSSSPSGISCGADCTESYNQGTVVTLTLTADSGSVFTGWSGGGCSGTGNCVLTMDAAKTVTATFLLRFTLTMNKNGTGGGSVTSVPTGISCGADCTEQYNDGTSVTLTASADSGSTFAGWSGCDSQNGPECTVAMSANKTVTATFNLITHLLTVQKGGSGTGTVSSSPSGISCGADCTESYNQGTVVTLTVTADSGSVFTGWSGGGCSGTGNCVLTMDAAKTVTATFLLGRILTINKGGTGGGTVTSDSGNINCGGTCSDTYVDGTTVVLTATPDGTSTFTSWSGCTSTNGNECTVLMNSNKTVTATFTKITYNLHVDRTLTGGASGTVDSSPTGINCGSDCDQVYDSGTSVTLTATAGSGSRFVSWNGCNSTAGNQCTVNMTSAKTVTATFIKLWTLTLNKTGTVQGTVTSTSNPPGPEEINCATACTSDTATYDHGTVVTLTRSGGVGFQGWSVTPGGGCPGTGTCVVTMNSDITVTAAWL